MTFHTPIFLLLLVIIVPLVFFFSKRNSGAGVTFSAGELLGGLKRTRKVRLRSNLVILRCLALGFMIIALARPQAPVFDEGQETEGIDIVLAIDSSTSMLAEDFKIGGSRLSRIEIVKRVVEDFVKARARDRIGIVTFAARAYTVCPLTTDYAWLLEHLARIRAGMVEDGTAIGSGIASAVNRLRNSKAKSKVIILLTDGRNNAGKIAPLVAAEAARALKIKIHAIGAGSKGLVPYPARDIFGRTVYQQVQIDLDEDTLQKIASVTQGKYFRATDTQSLQKVYQEIDAMEKTLLPDTGFKEYRELFFYFLIPGIVLLLLEIVLANTMLRKIP